jgi:hypothetical protein
VPHFDTDWFIAAIVKGTDGWTLSAKIQQLLNTLKQPKRRPQTEFYEDDDIELETAANPKDPNAPKPESSSMTSAVGEHGMNMVFMYVVQVCTAYVTLSRT